MSRPLPATPITSLRPFIFVSALTFFTFRSIQTSVSERTESQGRLHSRSDNRSARVDEVVAHSLQSAPLRRARHDWVPVEVRLRASWASQLTAHPWSPGVALSRTGQGRPLTPDEPVAAWPPRTLASEGGLADRASLQRLPGRRLLSPADDFLEDPCRVEALLLRLRRRRGRKSSGESRVVRSGSSFCRKRFSRLMPSPGENLLHDRRGIAS